MKRSIVPTLALVVLAAASTACLSKQLKSPTEDHYIQTRVIYDACVDGTYGIECPEDLKEDLDMMKAQACAIDAITKSQKPEECKVEAQK